MQHADDLHLEEIDVWNILIKWGTAQTGLSFNNPNEWTSEDFSKLTLKLNDCIQYIRFYHISGADFYNHVMPFKFLIPKDLFEELLCYYYKGIKPQPINAHISHPKTQTHDHEFAHQGMVAVHRITATGEVLIAAVWRQQVVDVVV